MVDGYDDGGVDARVDRLLEDILESGDSPEVACRACLELLPEVRARLRRLRELEEQVSALFPPSDDQEAAPAALRLPTELPNIEGYEVLDVLGHGGMGIVFRAHHLRLKRFVAMKMILAGEFALPAQRERFLREAEAIAAISHPNIVQLYNAGESDGRPWFTMELVDGGSLARKIGGVPQPSRPSARLVRDLSEGVAAAHRHGIVHRDLKPGNVLLTPDGAPKVTDFGLAHWSPDGAEGAAATLSGAALGTPSYMAPEQARGAAREIGPATDVYALGTILYELLTGRPPFHGETPSATVQQVLTTEVVPPSRLNPRVPRDLQTICLKCLQKAPSRRYADAAELADELGRFLAGEPITARPVGNVERAVLWIRRHPALGTALAAAVLLAIAFAFAGAWWYRQRTASELDARVELRQAEQYWQAVDYANAAAALERATHRLDGIAAVSLRQAIDRASSTVDLLKRLDEIHLDRAVVSGRTGIENALLNPDAGGLRSSTRPTAARYADAFRSAGIGSPPGDDPVQVAARVRASPSREHLVAALDDWAARAVIADERRWILSVLNGADPDPWRDRARDPSNWLDANALQKLADEAPVTDQPPAILVLLAARLRAAGRSARPLMTRVVLAYPTDFWVNIEMGNAIYGEDPGEAIGYYRAALVARPHLAIMHDTIAFMYWRQQRLPEAIGYHQRAIRMEPGEAVFHHNYAWTLFEAGRFDDAISEDGEAIRLDPTYELPHELLSHLYAKQQRPELALEEARTFLRLAGPRFVELARARVLTLLLAMGRDRDAREEWRNVLEASPAPDDHDAWFGYAELCLFLDDQDGYRRARADLLRHFGRGDHPTTCERVAKACLLLDGNRAELETAAALADRAEAAERSSDGPSYPHDLFAQGLAAFRLGRFDDAIRLMNGRAASVGGPCPKLVVAMALYRTGHTDAARTLLSATVDASDWSRKIDEGNREPYWVAQVLRREAESLIKP